MWRATYISSVAFGVMWRWGCGLGWRGTRAIAQRHIILKASQELHQCDVLLPVLRGNSPADLASCERFGLHF